MRALPSNLGPRNLPAICKWQRCRRSSLTARPFPLPPPRRTRPYCSTRCVETRHSLRAEMKWKLSGVSSPPSRRRGRNCHGLRFPTTLLEVAVRGTPTLSLPAIIVGGVILNCRYKKPHRLLSQPLQWCGIGAIELLSTHRLYFQVLGVHQCCAVFSFVAFLPHLRKICSECSLPLRVEPGKCRLSWSKVLAEEVDHFRRRKRVTKLGHHRLARQALDGSAKALADCRFVAPQYGRGQAWGWRHMLSRSGKHLADKAGRRPIGHGDQPFRTAYPQHLRRDQLRPRRKHGAEHGDHGIERGIGITQTLGVAFGKGDLQSLLGRALPRLLKQVRSNVHTGHKSTSACFRDGSVAGAAGYVQHASTALDGKTRDELLCRFRRVSGDDTEVAQHPGGAHLRLQSVEIYFRQSRNSW